MIGAVVVVLGFVALHQIVDAETGGHRERADVVGQPGLDRRDEVRERPVGLVAAVGLLAEHRQRDAVAEHDVVAFAGGGPQPVRAPDLQRSVGLDLGEELLRIGEQLARLLAVDVVVEDLRERALQLPRREEEGPVDHVAELGDRRLDDARTRERRRRQRLSARHSIGVRRSAAIRSGSNGVRCRSSCWARSFAWSSRFSASKTGLRSLVEQGRRDADDARRVDDVDDRLVVRGRDPHRRVLPRGRRAADQQRGVELAALHLLRDDHHLVERGRDQSRTADQARADLGRRVEQASRPAPSRRGRSPRSCCSPSTTPTMFLPMSCTSPLTVHSTTVPWCEPPAFSASMYGSR